MEREGNGQEGRKGGRKRGWGKKQRTGEKSRETHQKSLFLPLKFPESLSLLPGREAALMQSLHNTDDAEGVPQEGLT